LHLLPRFQCMGAGYHAKVRWTEDLKGSTVYRSNKIRQEPNKQKIWQIRRRVDGKARLELFSQWIDGQNK
jgi:hypothetical protein